MKLLKIPGHGPTIEMFYINPTQIVCFRKETDLYKKGSCLIMTQGGPIFTPVEDYKLYELIMEALK